MHSCVLLNQVCLCTLLLHRLHPPTHTHARTLARPTRTHSHNVQTVANYESLLEDLQLEKAAVEARQRALAERSTQLQTEVAGLQGRLERSDQEMLVARDEAQQHLRQLETTRDYAGKLEAQTSQLKQGFQEAMQRLRSLSGEDSNVVDRRLVAKMLLSYFERNQDVGWTAVASSAVLGLSNDLL